MDKPAKALAAVLLLTAAGVVLAWQGQLVWTHGIGPGSQARGASVEDGGSGITENGYLSSGRVPGQALYGWSYPFAFPHDPSLLSRNPTGGGEN